MKCSGRDRLALTQRGVIRRLRGSCDAFAPEGSAPSASGEFLNGWPGVIVPIEGEWRLMFNGSGRHEWVVRRDPLQFQFRSIDPGDLLPPVRRESATQENGG